MAARKEAGRVGAEASFSDQDREAFAAGLEGRGQAAQGLERDLLTEMPLLYGSASAPRGDPGIVLARLHREEMLRRNGGGALRSSGKRSDVSLPCERAMTALALILFLWVLFGKAH